jgi:6-phosphofructokinase 1
MAGELVKKGLFGNMVALRGTEIVAVPLSEVSGKLKSIPVDAQVLQQAKYLGISMGV